MKTHRIKLIPNYYKAVIEGTKTFEIRVNDRNYEIGDKVILLEYDPEVGFTGRKVSKYITFITSYAQQQDYVVFSIANAPLKVVH